MQYTFLKQSLRELGFTFETAHTMKNPQTSIEIHFFRDSFLICKGGYTKARLDADMKYATVILVIKEVTELV